MRLSVLSSILVSLLITQFSLAATSASLASVPDESCGRTDSYDTPSRLSPQAKRYGDQCIYTKKFRPAIILEHTDSKIQFANYLHKNKYHIADVSLTPEAIDKVLFQTMPFPAVPGVMAGHIQIRFRMNPGFEIKLQDQVTGQFVESTKDIMISYEAAFPEGVSYNFAAGAIDSYALVGRVVSGEQRLSEGPNREFDQYELALTAEEQVDLLEILLLDSDQIAMKGFYNTVRPNCTSKVFDAIDQLPRFSEKFRPFLTHISGDPVIGPAVEALLERNLIRQRVQDMKDEFKGDFHQLSVKRPESTPIPFIAQIPDRPMSIVSLRPQSSELSATQKQVLEDLEKDIIAAYPEALTQLITTGFSSNDPKEIASLLGITMQSLIERLKIRIERDSVHLPESPHVLNIYIAPYATKGLTDIRHLGVDAIIPIGFIREEVNKLSENMILGEIEAGIEDTDHYSDSSSPGYLKAFVLRLNLQKGRTTAEAQALLGINPMTKSLVVSNDQVDISQIIIPEPGTSGKKVSALLTYNQVLSQPTNDTLQVEFGTDLMIKGSSPFGLNGQLSLDTQALKCLGRPATNPTLVGTLSKQATGFKKLDRWLDDSGVIFRITHLNFDIDDLKVKDIKISAGLKGIQCVRLGSINQQFRGEINSILDNIKEDLRKKFLGN